MLPFIRTLRSINDPVSGMLVGYSVAPLARQCMCPLLISRSALASVSLLCLATSVALPQNFPPSARISMTNSEAFVSEPIHFSGADSFDPDSNPQPLTYEWDFSDGSRSTEMKPVHAFAVPGAYRVSLTVSDGADTDVTFTTVFVLARPTTGNPAKTSPIAFSPDEQQLWMTNPDSHSVTLFDIAGETPAKVAEIPVGKLPRTVAISLDGRFAFVACQEADQLWVIDTATRTLNRKIRVGHQPYGVAVSPTTGQILVSNQGDNSVSMLSPDLNVAKVFPVNGAPRAIAVTADGQYAFVSHFITRDFTGRVTRMNLESRSTTPIPLAENPGPDTPSSSAGFPNLLSALTVEPSGNAVWLGGLKSNSRRGEFLSGRPLTPENTVRGFFGPIVVDPTQELLERRIDSNNADSISAIAFSPSGRFAYVTHQGAEMLSVYDVLRASQIIPGDGTPVPFETRIDVGSAPQGILVSSNGQRAYVANLLSRDLTVIDLSNPTNPVVSACVESTIEPLPLNVANGKRLFYRSRAPKHSRDNYIACASCHADGGMDDGQSWDFTQRGEGLRNTTDLRGRGGMGHGPVHWSANFDEIQDFENDIVNQFGGTGLAQDGQPPNPPLGSPNAGRSQDLDDLAVYVSSLIRPARSPSRKYDGTLSSAALRGKALFLSSELRCADCHVPPRFTDSTTNFLLHDVGTLTPASGNRLGGPLPGIDTPTLVGLWNTAPYLHDGSALSLESVLVSRNSNDQHGVTSQLSATQVSDLVAYLMSIDDSGFDEPADNDRDGISDSWELLFDLDPNDPTDAVEDPDSDGMTNRAEFVAATDPTEFYSKLVVRQEPAIWPVIEFRIPTAKDQSYTLEYFQNLAGPPSTATNFSGDGAEFRFATSANGPHNFYRVRVNQP